VGIKIDKLICKGCSACLYVCPVGALELEDMKVKVTDACISCGQCVPVCNWMAITLEKEPPEKKD